MEKKRLKEIEAKFNQLLMQIDKSKKPEAKPSSNHFHGTKIIRRRKGHTDLHFT